MFAETERLDCGFCGFYANSNPLYTYRAHNGIAEVSMDGSLGQPVPAGTEAAAVHVTFGFFTTNAVANIDSDPEVDAWYINDANQLVHPADDVNQL